MAFGFGVSDVLQLTKFIITAIEDIHDAPTELQELAERVESVEANLHSINKLPNNLAADHAQNISRLVRRINETLSQIRDIVTKYSHTDGFKSAWKRAKFGVWEKGGVGELVEKLEQRTCDLTNAVVIQVLLVTNQMRPQVDQIFAAVCQQQETVGKPGLGQSTSSVMGPKPSNDLSRPFLPPTQMNLVQSVLEHVLHSDQSSNTGSSSNQEDTSIEKVIETEFGRAGIESDSTKAFVDSINKQRKQLAHPEDIDPISTIGGKKRLETPKGWIMVVDSFNEGESMIPPAYKNPSLTLLKYDLS